VRDAIRASAGDDAVKRRQCLDLAALYRAIVKLLPDADQFGTADQTRQRLRDTANTMLGSDEVLREVRRVVAVELAAVLPTVADAALTDAHRAAAVKVFERLAGILEEAGK
jgi:predicted GTPase